MQLEVVAVFHRWDFDHKNRQLYGMSLHLLNAAARIELAQSCPPNLVVNKGIFAKEDWFEQLWQLMCGKSSEAPHTVDCMETNPSTVVDLTSRARLILQQWHIDEAIGDNQAEVYADRLLSRLHAYGLAIVKADTNHGGG